MSKNKVAIVRTDGGIASQLHFYGYALELEKKGYDISFEMSYFFEERERVLSRSQERNYDLEKAFPIIKTKICDKKQLDVFKKKYEKRNLLLERAVDNNIYVTGYSNDRFSSFAKNINFFRENFNPVDKELCSDILKRILECNSCAVHVRRDDMVEYLPAFGHQSSLEYWVNAIRIVKTLKGSDVKFFFFSDGMDFVKNEIIPKVENEIEYELVDRFRADKGYLDLYLISHADSIIGSSGCFAATAKLLSMKDPLFITSRLHYPVYAASNCIYINDDVAQLNRFGGNEKKPKKIKKPNAFKKFWYPLVFAFSFIPIFANLLAKKRSKLLQKINDYCI